jgi:hypothetical protein
MIAIRLAHQSCPDLTALITFGVRSDDIEFRLTYSDDRGPSGHTCRDTWQQCLELAYREGYTDLRKVLGDVSEERVAVEVELQRRADEARWREIEDLLAEIPAPAQA